MSYRGGSVKADTTAHLSSFTKPSTYRKMQHTGAKPTIYDTLSSTRYLRSQPPTQLADFVAAVTATPTPLGSPSIDLIVHRSAPTTVAFSSRHVAFSALAHNGWLIFALSRCSGFFTWGNFTQHLMLSVIFTSEMFNPVIKIHGRHISSVLQSFTIQMVLTVDICFTYSTDDLSNFHQISLDSQPGSNKPTAGRLVSELSRMDEDLFSPDNYELGILLCRLGVAIKFQIFGGKKRTELEAGIS
ncbi:hypothetical protein B0H14DRAFT_2622494 [Mycena olivaceomarginata]|nr:hypothetical protein B0H14DRAFT_2622494 [Mycena olivaceomarginata]